MVNACIRPASEPPSTRTDSGRGVSLVDIVKSSEGCVHLGVRMFSMVIKSMGSWSDADLVQ